MSFDISKDQNTITAGDIYVFEEVVPEMRLKKESVCRLCAFQTKPKDLCNSVPCLPELRKDGKDGIFKLNK